MSKNIFVLSKVKHLLEGKTLRMLYCALVLPYITYCVEVWGNSFQTHVKTVYLLQKRAIRIISNAGFREHTNVLFLKAKLLKFNDIVELQTLMVMFQAKDKVLPANLQRHFNLIEEEGRRKGQFRHQMARTTAKRRCISVVGVKLWNSLQNELKQCKNIFQFKKIFKDKTWMRYERL